MSEAIVYFADEKLVCYDCDAEIVGDGEWVDTFYLRPRYIGPFCRECVERTQEPWEE